MNIQHSSRQDSWMTPKPIIEMVRAVLGHISLDPASSHQANKQVGAESYIDDVNDGLSKTWFGSVYCNPPGGKVGNQSKTFLFWEKLMRERDARRIEHAVFMFFSVEGLAISQGRSVLAATKFPVCIPKKRIKFDWPGAEVKSAPSHSNAVVYVPGHSDCTREFYRIFSPLGDIMGPI